MNIFYIIGRRGRYRSCRFFGIARTNASTLRDRLDVSTALFRGGWWPWLSVMATNVAIAAIAAGLIRFVGLGSFLLVQLPTILLAGSIGVWLFYVQHQFEMTFWAHEGEWTFQEAALHGSSHYDLPGILRWFTANIGVHHVHHLSSRIPYYRLRRALRDHHELGGVNRLTLLQSLRCVRLVLWDEDQCRLVSFQRVRLPERAETLPVPLTRRLPLQSRGAAVVGGTDLNVNTIVETKLSLRAPR